ncbi:hypothetical protein BdWA1_001108 [Babesia duncani]|uniref:Uncharacterized protein n=1 Tax=Babesia duncani TaxID=323732 RepID=A0AAD9PPC5_9APIC|nr:hypothetical protein BdWA1_001108 [Babesia duncani]
MSHFGNKRRNNPGSLYRKRSYMQSYYPTFPNGPGIPGYMHQNAYRPHRGHSNLNFRSGTDNKYESEEFRSQKEKLLEQKARENQQRREIQQQLQNMTLQLNNFVAELAALDKDSPQRQQLSDKIAILKGEMKALGNNVVKKPEKPRNKLDNRETRLVFEQLPQDAIGQGNLAKWISANAKIMLPKQIAMLAAYGTNGQGALVQYSSHEVAASVLQACKENNISVSWMSS